MAHYRHLIVLLALHAIPYVHADEQMHLTVQAGGERFRWREFDAIGTRLLEEKGPRVGIGAAWNNFRRTTPGFIYGANGRLYFGTVDYDGQACNFLTSTCEPFASETSYSGINIEAQGGYRFGSRFGVGLLGAVGVDNWIRTIEGGKTQDGEPVSGGEEEYTIAYLKFAPGVFHNLDAWSYRLYFGVKYPFYTYEYLGDPGAPTLSPKGRASGFARLEVDIGRSRRLAWGFAIYYDSYRFEESEHEDIVFLGIPGEQWQPESHMDVRGVQFRFSIF